AAPLPGPAVVGLDPHRMVRPDGWLHEEGHAPARRVRAEVRHQVHAEALGSAERHLCPRGWLGAGGPAAVPPAGGVRTARGQGAGVGRLTRRGARRRGSVPPPALRGRASAGGVGRRVRRLTVPRTEPTRNGEPPLPILTHGPPHRTAAVPRARVYGTRG